jgi:hypothetical protein
VLRRNSDFVSTSSPINLTRSHQGLNPDLRGVFPPSVHPPELCTHTSQHFLYVPNYARRTRHEVVMFLQDETAQGTQQSDYKTAPITAR